MKIKNVPYSQINIIMLDTTIITYIFDSIMLDTAT